MTGDIGILASWRVFERSSPYQIYVEIFADLLGVRITPEKEILSRRLLSGADYTFKASESQKNYLVDILEKGVGLTPNSDLRRTLEY